jgi:uncharacterized protein
MTVDGTTYLLVDGENIDWALGGILDRKPDPHERPRWQHILQFAEAEWAQPVRALFYINASRGLHAPFVQALIALGYRPIPLSGRAEQKVVDVAIQRTLVALQDGPGDVLLASHDADFAQDMGMLASLQTRRLGLVVFSELVAQGLRDVPGIQIFDLEDHARAFDVELPRVRVIPLDDFDPHRFL